MEKQPLRKVDGLSTKLPESDGEKAQLDLLESKLPKPDNPHEIRAAILGLVRVGYRYDQLDPKLVEDMLSFQQLSEQSYLPVASIDDMIFTAKLLKLYPSMPEKEAIENFILAISPEKVKVSEAAYYQMMTGIRWFLNGFPVIRIPPKWMAAAMCTRIPSEGLQDIRAPWSVFKIKLPKEELLYVYDKDSSRRFPVNVVTVSCSETSTFKWCMYVGCVGSGLLELVLKNDEELAYGSKLATPDDNDPNTAVLKLVGRLVASTIFAITNKHNLTQVNKETHVRYETIRKSKTVVPTKELEFQLIEPVTVDLRERVLNFQKEPHKKGKSIDIQFMVMGHRKMQPYGPSHSLRKQIWIEPYWKGPLDAPVALRPHNVKDAAE